MTIPAVGSDFSVLERTGYTYYQNRPADCRPACVCGGCFGTVTEHWGVVSKVEHFADNSVEVVVECEDGESRRQMVVQPHGDRCF